MAGWKENPPENKLLAQSRSEKRHRDEISISSPPSLEVGLDRNPPKQARLGTGPRPFDSCPNGLYAMNVIVRLLEAFLHIINRTRHPYNSSTLLSLPNERTSLNHHP
ncbi:hypothetical protein PGTUg99_003785 [Puccinia graminis f. sp. tritici]|uniref:Uncharacterized protein n=1 Tax=Puccinia graminis f. sp. tritici TaxID=56615 RepID=A0A5B0REP1_PUCGR|nr:hypothetical protein PGTUg99_003785 [Puccinia graminis f. sp. tritici]